MLSKIFHIILESNTLNFLVFAGFIWLICKKIKLGDMISSLQQKTEIEINNATNTKKESENLLVKAENKMKNVENDVEEIIRKTEKTAETIAKNIIESSKGQIEIIEHNAQKALQNDIHKTKRALENFTIKKSIELTKSDIKKRLNENTSLHQIYIDEALNELEGISF